MKRKQLLNFKSIQCFIRILNEDNWRNKYLSYFVQLFYDKAYKILVNNFLECLTKKDERFNPMKCFKGMIGLAWLV